MPTIVLAAEDDFDGWRDNARSLMIAGVPPDAALWQIGDVRDDLFADTAPAPDASGHFAVPRAFIDLARTVVCHRSPERFSLLYTFLHRLRHQPDLIADNADPARRRLDAMARQVRRDIHKMRAFLRFREIAVEGEPRFVAWFEPEHHILRANAGFFINRFAAMRWSILTPAFSIHWDGERLTEGPGATRGDAPSDDPVEAVWKRYYASIFNPARVKVGAMLKEMPKKYWKNMPETALIPALIASAQAREAGMIETAKHSGTGGSAAALRALSEEAQSCTRCPLHRDATQTIFGEGPADARLMLVGEQPGDQEDLAGRPFVGPAGQMLDRALVDAGIDRTTAYLTNAVKHFKFEQRGKRRIHAKPDAGEIQACRWWIDQERMLVRPTMTIALGATAARSLLGKVVTISRERGRPIRLPDGSAGWITVHPSYLLRIDDAARAHEEYHRFVDDLTAARMSME